MALESPFFRHCRRLIRYWERTDPAVKRRGRGFDPINDGPAQDGLKNVNKFDLIDGDTSTQEKAAKCECKSVFSSVRCDTWRRASRRLDNVASRKRAAILILESIFCCCSC